MNPESVRMNALVGLLNDHSPDQVAELRRSFPDHEKELSLSVTMGEADPEQSGANADLWLAVVEKGLHIARERARPNLMMLQRRLARARFVRLASEIAAAISGAGILIALLVGDHQAATITAVINLLTTMAALVSSHLETSVQGRKLMDLYEELVRSSVEADQLLGELEVYRQTSPAQELVMQIVQKANGLAAKLRSAEYLLGTPAMLPVETAAA